MIIYSSHSSTEADFPAPRGAVLISWVDGQADIITCGADPGSQEALWLSPCSIRPHELGEVICHVKQPVKMPMWPGAKASNQQLARSSWPCEPAILEVDVPAKISDDHGGLMEPQDRPWARATHRSPSQMPDLQKLQDD